MPLIDRFLTVKKELKELLGVRSRNASSSSLHNASLQTRSPSPTPQIAPRTSPPTRETRHTEPSDNASPQTHAPHTTPAGPVSAAPPLATTSRGSPSHKSAPRDNLEAGAVQGIPESPKPAAWSGLKTLLSVLDSGADVFPPLGSSASKAQKEYEELYAKLDSLLGDLSVYISNGANPKMTTSMKNLCYGLNKELEVVQMKYARGTLQRHTEASDDSSEIMESYRRIHGHLERLALNANLDIWETISGLETERRLQKLSPMSMSAVYNSAESEDVQRRACTPGTRTDEVGVLLDWVGRESHEKAGGVYWMDGMAGTGKTTILYSLCVELEKSAKLGASFFCSRLIPGFQNVKLIIPAIAYQLARFSSRFCCALLEELKADPDAQARKLEIQFNNLLVKPLSKARDTLPTDFIVVIDALDECESESGISQILNILLFDPSTSNLPVRFLISSRPEPQIYYQMKKKIGADHRFRLVLHELDKSKVQRDIETYLKAELGDVNLQTSQITALASHSGALFIYASTAARYIKGGLPLGLHETRLNMILGLVPPSKDGKDRHIDELYRSILKNAFENQNLDQSNRNQMRTILDAVVCAQEPLTAAGLTGLLNLQDVKHINGLLMPLRSVLNVSEKTGSVATLHASFPDFMLDNERSCAFCCDAEGTHARIAHSCFVVMGVKILQFNLCGLESSCIRDKQVPNMAERVDTAISEELFYACRYWAVHLELGGRKDSGRDLIHEFLMKRLLLWMEVLSLKESMQLGPKILQRAADWCRAHAHSKEILDLAHDAWRFVTMYASHAVSQSTPHIYVSMLPFWPETAPVSKHYTKRMQGAIRAHGSAMTRRQLSLLATWSFADAVRSVCLSPDGTLIAYAMTSSVYVIDGTTGRAILGPLEHTDEVNSVAFSPDGTLLVSGADDSAVKVWKTIDGQPAVGALTGHTDFVSSVAFSPDGKHVVSGSRDGAIRVWSLENGLTIVGPLHGQDDEVWSIGLSSGGSRIASGHGDGTIHVWSAESGQMLFGPFTGHTDCVRSVCFSPDGMRLASGSDDNTIRLWSNLTSQPHVEVLKGHTEGLNFIAFSPDGKQLVSGSDDDTVRLWDVQGTPQLARVFTGHTNTVWCVRFSSDGARIVSSSADSTIRVWDARSQGPANSLLEGHTQAITSVAFSHGSSRIVSGSNDGTIYVWDGQSGQVAVGPMKGHSDWVLSVCVSPDGSRIASGSKDESALLWEAYTGQAVGKLLTGHSGEVRSVCFSPDGALLASSSDDETIRLWNAESGEPVGSPLEAHTNIVLSVFFSPDSQRLVSGSGDEAILVWDVNTGKPVLSPLEGHTDAVGAVCVSPDGTRIASGSVDTTVRLWDANDGQSIIGPLLGHTADVNSVCFSPNGSYVISGSEDKTIRLWDARSGQAVGNPFVGHTDVVRSVAFSSDGGQIVSGSHDLSIRVWDIADLVQPQEPQDDINKSIESSHNHQSWVLQDDGWVVDPQSRLLAWVPPDLHASLMSPRNTLLISTKGFVRLDLESAKVGESWAECYEPTS